MKTRKSLAVAAIASSFVFLMGASAPKAQPALYDSATTPTKTPDQAGFFKLFTNTAPAPTGKATAGGTILNTGNISNDAGYGRQAPVKLDRTKGYSVSFSVKLNSETHTTSNSAGFNVIVTSDLLKGEKTPYGIELSFWPTSIWAKEVGFTPAEAVGFDTQSAVNNYTLVVQGTTYKLYANGSASPILQGPLRQYTGFNPPAGFPNPFTITSVIFLGDDSPSAQSEVVIKRIDAALTQTTSTTGTKK